MSVPQPLACDGQVTFDPASRALLVKVSGVGASFWRRGHAAMAAAEEAGCYWARPTVYGHVPGRRGIGRRRIARGEAVRDGWLRFKLRDHDYRELTSNPNLSAIAVVDQQTSSILSVKFRPRS